MVGPLGSTPPPPHSFLGLEDCFVEPDFRYTKRLKIHSAHGTFRHPWLASFIDLFIVSLEVFYTESSLGTQSCFIFYSSNRKISFAERNEGVNILAVFGQQAQDVNTLENSGPGGGEAPLT